MTGAGCVTGGFRNNTGLELFIDRLKIMHKTTTASTMVATEIHVPAFGLASMVLYIAGDEAM